MSRYSDVPTTTYEAIADGRHPPPRALLPAPLPARAAAVHSTLARHLVVPDDRLDLLSFRYTGDPLGFWRICDANAALDPDDLVDAEAVGTEIVVPRAGGDRLMSLLGVHLTVLAGPTVPLPAAARRHLPGCGR